MQLTNQQIETLKGKCPTCLGRKYSYMPETDEEWKCPNCLGSGQATIEIEKEWIECDIKHAMSRHPRWCKCGGGINFIENIGGDGKILKTNGYKVGGIIEELDSILNEEEHEKSMVRIIKLKIISETETKQRVIMVR